MSVATVIIEILAVLALVLLNGFFVAAEFGLVKVRATEIEPMIRKGSRRARSAQHVLKHLDTYLSASQLGITMTSLGLGWVGEPFVAELLRVPLAHLGVDNPAVVSTISFVVAFSIITFLHIVLGEQAPKWYAILHARETALAVSRPLEVFTTVFRPFIWLVNEAANWFLRLIGIQAHGESEQGHSAEELRLLLSRGEGLSALSKAISMRVMDFHDRTVREVMVPRTSVSALFTSRTLEENIAIALENQFTRYPLCERDLDNVVGMIHLKDLFRLKGESGPGSTLLSIKKEMLFVPETTPLEKMMSTFLTRRVLMATAVDEYGGTAGLVTLENVLEELVGEIRDEFDVEQSPVQRVGEEEFLVDGAMPLHEFDRAFGLELEEYDVVTVSGYALQLLGRLPVRGAVMRIGQWEATVEAVEGKLVKTLRLKRTSEGVGGQDNGGGR